MGISIHAPREGGDLRPAAASAPVSYFNPRPPRGGRHDELKANQRYLDISIHAPREGGDAAG